MSSELQILIEALEKKEKLLTDILDRSKKQQGIAGMDNFDETAFDFMVEEKSKMLKEMDKIDEGFDSVYERIRDELLANKDRYKTEIARLQELIDVTIGLGAKIHTTEERTKESMSAGIQMKRNRLLEKKKTSKAVSDYYKKNIGSGYSEPYFYDDKK